MYCRYHSHPDVAKRLQVKGSRRPRTIIAKAMQNKRVLIWACVANRCLHIILPWAVPANQAAIVPANRAAAIATRGHHHHHVAAAHGHPVGSPHHQHGVVQFGDGSLPEWPISPPSPSSLSVSSSSSNDEPSPLDMLPVPLPWSVAVSSPTTNVSRKRCRGDDVKDDDNKAQLKRHETDFYWLPEVNPAVWQLPPNLGQKQAELVKSEEVQENSVASEQATSWPCLQSLPQQVPTSSLPAIDDIVDASPSCVNHHDAASSSSQQQVATTSLPPPITVDALPSCGDPTPDVALVPFIGTLESTGLSENPFQQDQELDAGPVPLSQSAASAGNDDNDSDSKR
jgi:hypothetical protein